MNLNTEHRRMEDKSVTAFLLSPHYRTCRHLLLQIIVLLMTINVFWYEPLQSVSFWRRFGGEKPVLVDSWHILFPLIQ